MGARETKLLAANVLLQEIGLPPFLPLDLEKFVPLYNVSSLSMTTARDKVEIAVPGSFLVVSTDGTLSGVEIRLDRQNNDPIPLNRFNQFKSPAPWEKIFLTHTAQSGKTIYLLVTSSAEFIATRELIAQSGEPTGTPFTVLARLSTSSTSYGTVVSKTITAGKLGILKLVTMYTDTPGKTQFQLTIGGVQQFTNQAIQTSLAIPFPDDSRVEAAAVILLEAKSTDGTAIVVDGAISGSER